MAGQELVQAEAALRRFDGRAALAAYDGVLRNAADPLARARAGRVHALWLQRRYAEARDELAALLPAHEDSIHVQLVRGLVALGQPDDPKYLYAYSGSVFRDSSQAIDAFARALDLDGTCAEAIRGKAAALRMAGKIGEAESLLGEALSRLGSSVPIHIERAWCAVDRGQFDAALEELDRALNLNSGDLAVAMHWVEVTRMTGRNWEALKRSEQLVAATSDPPASLLEGHGWALFETCVLIDDPVARQSTLEAAQAAYEKSIKVGPANPGAAAGIALVHQEFGDAEGAQRAINDALAAEPDSPQLNLQRLRLQLDSMDAQSRHDAYLRVLDLDSRALEARFGLAYALRDLGRLEDARQVVASVLEEVPGNPGALEAQAWLDLGEGRLEEALAGFSRIRAATPENINAIVGAVQALRLVGAIEHAEDECERAIAAFPGSASIRNEYAFCALSERRYWHVRERSQKAGRIAPHDDTVQELQNLVRSRTRWRPLYRLWGQAVDNTAHGYAKTSPELASNQAHLIPQEIRERTLGRLRALEWRLARLRATEEVAFDWTGAPPLVTVAVVLCAAPGLASELLQGHGLSWPRWLGIAVLSLGAGLVLAILVETRRGRQQIGTTVVLPAIALVYLYTVHWKVPDPWVFAVLFGFVAPSLVLAVLIALNRTGIQGVRLRMARTRSRWPLATMLHGLIDLWVLLEYEYDLTSAKTRARCVQLLESVAAAEERAIRRPLDLQPEDRHSPDPWLFQPQASWERHAASHSLDRLRDPVTDQELVRCATEVACATRRFKREILLPKPTTWADLRGNVREIVAAACYGRWDDLPHSEPEHVVRRFQALLQNSARTLVIAVIAPAALLAYQFAPGQRPPAPGWLQLGLYVIWPLATILLRFDPDFAAKMNLISSLRGGDTAGGAKPAPPRR